MGYNCNGESNSQPPVRILSRPENPTPINFVNGVSAYNFPQNVPNDVNLVNPMVTNAPLVMNVPLPVNMPNTDHIIPLGPQPYPHVIENPLYRPPLLVNFNMEQQEVNQPQQFDPRGQDPWLGQQNSRPWNPDRITELVMQQLGAERGLPRRVYRKPHPD